MLLWLELEAPLLLTALFPLGLGSRDHTCSPCLPRHPIRLLWLPLLLTLKILRSPLARGGGLGQSSLWALHTHPAGVGEGGPGNVTCSYPTGDQDPVTGPSYSHGRGGLIWGSSLHPSPH